jgi:hypothetical protein
LSNRERFTPAAGCGRHCWWPRLRPLAVTCGYLTTRKTMQGRRWQVRATSTWRDIRMMAEMAVDQAGSSVVIGLRLRREFSWRLAYVALVGRPGWEKRRTCADVIRYPGLRIPSPNLGGVCITVDTSSFCVGTLGWFSWSRSFSDRFGWLLFECVEPMEMPLNSDEKNASTGHLKDVCSPR